MVIILVAGWPTPLKNDGMKVSWDDDIPNISQLFLESNKIPWFQTTNQVKIAMWVKQATISQRLPFL